MFTTAPFGIGINIVSPAALPDLRMVSWELILGINGACCYRCEVNTDPPQSIKYKREGTFEESRITLCQKHQASDSCAEREHSRHRISEQGHLIISLFKEDQFNVENTQLLHTPAVYRREAAA
jgi:hypothetical protein